ncbi:MAG: tRNA epoxyqueuosine(34) reductase QueG [Planctomycetota bacterium]|jgi:epoxyqueuosine reductase
MKNLTEAVKQQAIELGFDLVGITGAEPIDTGQIEDFKAWLAADRAAGMNYLHRNFEKRINPAQLMPGAKSVICVGLNYKPHPVKDFPGDTSADYGKIANYALYQDYHPFMKKGLKALAGFISNSVGQNNCSFKICVDSVPLAERALAQRAGLGFIGKNHMLINPRFGLQIFLGEIITDIELQCDKPMINHCPDCNKCVRACPAGALDVTGGFDANKCISYLTIEHKGDIADEFVGKIGNRLFGCDECVLACPYNLNATPCSNTQLKLRDQFRRIRPAEILAWEQSQFESFFADSVIKRLGLERFKRNAKVCLMNAGTV